MKERKVYGSRMNNGEESFLPLDDEEVFRAIDKHECFAFRRVPGRRLRGRRKGDRKKRSTDKERRRGAFRSDIGS